MRGLDKRTGSLFSYVGIEGRLRPDHTLRTIRALTDETLAALYSSIGRLSIAPQMLLRAMLLQAFYSVRFERQLMERMAFDLLFRWPHPELVKGRGAWCGRAGVERLDLLEEPRPAS